MVILCTIDLETREVSLPAGQVIASYDHNVDVIRFQAEAIPGFSLNTSSIKIAAQGPNKARHDYSVDPSTVQIEEETGYITFDWPIPAGVTEMPIGTFKYGDKGNLIFSVCAEIIDGSTLSQAWHSDDGIITVVAHLEPEAGGGEDPSETATNAQMIAQLQTDVAVISTQVGALANGSPTPVATVAEMTDESAVYLYTGSETGYTAGNWYYYDGTAWTSGGTYGGATTSTTFNQHGVPADDFAVGEALAEKADADDVTALTVVVERDIDDINGRLGYTNDTVGAYIVEGTATQATRYTDTVAVDNISFDAYCKYNIRLSNANPIAITTYGYLKDAQDNILMPCNITANESTATYSYLSTQDMTGCKVTFLAGVNDVTVSVNVSKDISVQQDIAEYEQVLNLNTHSGYIKVNGTTGTATTEYSEVYTDYIDVDLINKIRYSLIYPTANVLWLKACVNYKDGTFARLDITNAYGDFVITSTMDSIAFTYKTYGQCDFRAVAIGLKNGDLSRTIAETNTKATTAIKKALIAYNNPFEFLPCWDHLFVSRSTTWVTIPHESLFHVRISRLFGAKVIEANLWKTSDGVFIVNHLASGKFGGYFHHVDGTTDISNMRPSDVTWNWIVSNLRYNSRIAKYQTRPPRLEEFLAECKQQNIIPMITANDADAVAIIRQYLGNNYIAYDGNRETSPDNYIFEWKSYATKESIIEYCDSIGAPLIYGINNIGNFSETELKDIINALHEKGYLVCCAYVYDNWARYSSYGIDVNAAIQQINRLQNGNICNFESLYGFDNYTYTNATETDGILTFSADGTIEPNIFSDVLDMCAVDLEISFSGSITIPIFGEHVNATTITSDGTQAYFQCTPIIGGSPKVAINVSKDTVIYDMKYKATRI